MTALVTLEHVHRLSHDVHRAATIYPAAEDSQIGLVPGERMSVHDLLIALLLPERRRRGRGPRVQRRPRLGGRFVGMMNARARAARAHPHALLDADRARHARATTRARPIWSSSRATCCSTSRSSRASVGRAARGAADRQSRPRYVVNRNDLVGRVLVDQRRQDRPHDRCRLRARRRRARQGGMTLLERRARAPRARTRATPTRWRCSTGASRSSGCATPVTPGARARPADGQGSPRAHARRDRGLDTCTHVFAGRAQRQLSGSPCREQLAGPLPRGAVVGSVRSCTADRLVPRIPLLLAAGCPPSAP